MARSPLTEGMANSGVVNLLSFHESLLAVTLNVPSTLGAALYSVLPAWLARITAWPAPVAVKVEPVTVIGPEILLNVMGNDESAEAERRCVVPLYGTSAGVGKVMDCEAMEISNPISTSAAGAQLLLPA